MNSDESKSFEKQINYRWYLLVIIVITFISFASSIKNEMWMWDDNAYLTNNEVVKSPETTVKDIFTKPSAGNLAPVHIAFLRLEYKMFGLQKLSTGNSNEEHFDGTMYHFTSLLLHVGVTALIFYFFLLLSSAIPLLKEKAVLIASVTALLHGIHPMHVESVAWVSAQKDLLYSLFYFAGLLSYLALVRGTTKSKYWWLLLLTIIFFTLSLASKAMAVTFPVILFGVDYCTKRKMNWKIVAEKVPFMVIALIGGIITLYVQKGAGMLRAGMLANENHATDMHAAHYNFPERIMLSSYACITYIWKALLPINQSVFYPYPSKINGYPLLVSLSPFILVVLLGLLAYMFWKLKSYRGITILCALLFFGNLVLVVQILPIGSALMAERYTYLSYSGLFFGGAVLISRGLDHVGSFKKAVAVSGIGVIILLGYLTSNRAALWHDTKTLLVDGFRKNPGSAFLCNEIGVRIMNATGSNMDSSLAYFHKAMKLGGENSAYVSLAYLYSNTKKYDSCIYYCGKTLQYQPNFVQVYLLRASTYELLGKYDSSIRDSEAALRLLSSDSKQAPRIYYNISHYFQMENMSDSAMWYRNKAEASR